MQYKEALSAHLAQSRLLADLARDALARSIKPTMWAEVAPDNGDPTKAVGNFGPGADLGAVEIEVTWHMRDGRILKEYVDALVPEPSGLNPHLPYQMALGGWRGSRAQTLDQVVIEYSDTSKRMRWRMTRRFLRIEDWKAEGREPPAGGLVDWLDSEELVYSSI